MTMTDDIRTYLSENTETAVSVPEVAIGVGVTNKQASSVLTRLVKNGTVLKLEAGGFKLASAVEAPEEPESSDSNAEEDLIGDGAVLSSTGPETLFYESIDFPGNYSIVMAPFAVEIAEAAKVPAKVETFPGKLVRRVWFGGDDMDAAKAVRELVEAEALAAHEELKTWQKANLERRRGLTDMQKYVEHREQLAAFGHKVARRVKKGGGVS
jgi:hypothetical protein